MARLATCVGRGVPLSRLKLDLFHEVFTAIAAGMHQAGQEGSCVAPTGGSRRGLVACRGASGPFVLFEDLNNDQVAAASGTAGLGAGDATASRADSLLSTTEIMLLMDLVAMDGSLSKSQQISTSIPESRMSRTTESV